MNIGWPEGIWFGLAVLSLLAAAVLDGNPKTGNHSLAASMLSTALGFGLLYWGGFFS